MERRTTAIEGKDIWQANERRELSLKLINRLAFANLATVEDIPETRHELIFWTKEYPK
jgi:hypothetical protein